MKKRELTGFELVWYLGVFGFLFVWFTQIHPLVVYDADDWTYLAYVRSATPIWGDWNPAKVFPETVMPFFSTVAVYTLMPLLGDYILAQTVMHALVVSAFITVYVFCFTELVKRVLPVKTAGAVSASALFLLLHFLIFRSRQQDNSYLFFCFDLNCYYNYLIPGLLNASLVMYMLNNPGFDAFLAGGSPAKKGIFYLVLYYAIFSNLTTSGILAALAGSCLLISIIRKGKSFRLGQFVRENALYLGILLAWLVSAIFELSGGRATSSEWNGSFAWKLKYTLYGLKEVALGCNPVFWCVSVGCVVAAIAALVVSRGKKPGNKVDPWLSGVCIVAAAAILVYTLFLCAAVSPSYIYRSEYLFEFCFFGLMTVSLCFAYLLSVWPKLFFFTPLALCILVSQINTRGATFQESTVENLDPKICAEISRDIIDQYVQADQAGQKQMLLYVPVHTEDPDTQDNWPHSVVLLPRITNTLYEHGIISYPIDITVVPSVEMNEKYHLEIPQGE